MNNRDNWGHPPDRDQIWAENDRLNDLPDSVPIADVCRPTLRERYAMWSDKPSHPFKLARRFFESNWGLDDDAEHTAYENAPYKDAIGYRLCIISLPTLFFIVYLLVSLK